MLVCSLHYQACCACVLGVNGFKGPRASSVHAAWARENNTPVTGGQIGWQLHCWRTASQTHFFTPPPQYTQTHSRSFRLYSLCSRWTKLFQLSCGIQDDKQQRGRLDVGGRDIRRPLLSGALACNRRDSSLELGLKHNHICTCIQSFDQFVEDCGHELSFKWHIRQNLLS